MKKILLSSLIAFLMSGFLIGQERNYNKLDSVFDVLNTHNKYMGSIALMEKGELIYNKSVGYSDIRSGTVADKDSKYRIGSMSKTMTAVLVFMAVDENLLTLNQNIEEFFPEINNAGKITIQNLLNHSSGIPNFTEDPKYLEWNTKEFTREEIMKKFDSQEARFKPSSQHAYSNSNYLLLSFILEDLYKANYAEILNNKLVKKLHLKHTYYEDSTEIEKNEVYSYVYRPDSENMKVSNGWQKENETHMSIPLGAGGIVSTPTDFASFLQALFAGKLISDSSLEKMLKVDNSYGSGIFRMPYDDKLTYGHTGAIDGFHSMFAYLPGDSLAVVICGNAVNYNSNDLMLAALNSYYNKNVKVPEFSSARISTSDLKVYEGTYSSETFPLDVKIFISGNNLMAQATGQSAFALDYEGKHNFSFQNAGIKITFTPSEDSMKLTQGGMTNILYKNSK